MARDNGQKVRVEILGLLDEAVASLTQRKVRTVLTGLGTVLGVGVLVAVLGLTTTASSQIDSRFNALSATEVTIAQTTDPVQTRSMAFPDDFAERVTRIEGVQEAGLTWRVSSQAARLRAASVPRPGAPGRGPSADVMALSPGALRVAGVEPVVGGTYGQFHQRSESRVALVGRAVAAELGISSLSGNPTVRLGGVSLTVIGVVGEADRHPGLLNSVMVPSSTVRALWGGSSFSDPPVGWVEVEQGAGQVVADQLAVATDPTSPEKFSVTPPPRPRELQGSVSADLQSLFLVLAVVCLIVGMVGIANTTFVTVMERLGEIGLRRSLGARRSHIAAQFLVEAAVIGLLGGLLGALLGLGVVVGVAIARDWTAVVPPELVAAGPALGATTALVASAYPALRAAATQPVVALQVGAN